MTLQIDIGEARAQLSALLARGEAGEDVVIAREGHPVARLVPVGRPEQVTQAIAALRALRARPDAKPVTVEEILAWRHEGHDR